MKSKASPGGSPVLATAVILSLLVVVATVFLYASGRDDGTPAVFLRAPLPRPTDVGPVPRKRARARVSSGNPGFIVVPLQYSPPDYGFLIQVSAGDDNSLAVFDTGSSQLALATDDCVEDKLCSAKDAGYDPKTSPTAEITSQTATLRFATLDIRARIVNDEVSLFPITRPQAKASRAPGRPRLGSSGEDFVIGKRFPVYAATEMTGTRSNVFGFTPCNNRDSVFLQCMKAVGCRRSWSLACHSDGTAWLCVGDPTPGSFMHTKLSRCHYCPFSTGMKYHNAFILDVKKTRVGASVKDGPDFVVLDTGTSDSYLINVPCENWGLPDTGKEVLASELTRMPTITFYLDGTLVKISPRRYMHKHTESGKYVTCLHKNDPEISAIFPGNKRILLLGIQHILGMCLHFDIDRKQIGIGKA